MIVTSEEEFWGKKMEDLKKSNKKLTDSNEKIYHLNSQLRFDISNMYTYGQYNKPHYIYNKNEMYDTKYKYNNIYHTF